MEYQICIQVCIPKPLCKTYTHTLFREHKRNTESLHLEDKKIKIKICFLSIQNVRMVKEATISECTLLIMNYSTCTGVHKLK